MRMERMVMMVVMMMVMLYLGKADCMEVRKAGGDLRDQSQVWGGKVERMPC